jgi:hypothetical protein
MVITWWIVLLAGTKVCLGVTEREPKIIDWIVFLTLINESSKKNSIHGKERKIDHYSSQLERQETRNKLSRPLNK